MTTDNVPMQEPVDQPLVTEEVAKPKRTRRTKAAEHEGGSTSADAGAPSASASAAESVAESVAEGEAPVAARKAPARRRKAASADAPVADAADGAAVAPAPASDASAAEEVAPKPKRAPRKKAVEALEQVEAEPSMAPVQAHDAASEATPHGTLELGPQEGAEAGGESETDQAEPEAQRAGAEEGRGGRRGRDRERQRGARPDRVQGARPAGQDAADDEAGGEGVDQVAGAEEPRPSRRAAIAAEQTSEVFAELLSGDFDKQREEEAAAAAEGEEGGVYKRVLRPEPDAPKLQKVLAQAGVGSRRDIEQMIEDGRIEVNDQVAHIGQRVSFGDRIKVAGRPIKVRIAPPPARILAYHKPVGEVVTHDDPQGRPTVFQRLPKLSNGKWMSVGRLDLNTEGLLLFTNSGELANQLMHPRFGVEREYAVRVLGSLDDAARQKLLAGVEIEGQTAAFLSISQSSGEGVNQWYRVVIAEGRNREVRKLFDAVGLTVNRLIRVRYGAVVLPRGLRRGVWVELGESDVRAVKSLAGMDRQEFGQGLGQGQGRGGKGQQKGQQAKGKQGGQQHGGQHGRGGQQGQGGRPQGGQGGQGGFAQNKPPRQQPERQQQAPRHDDDELDHIGPIPNPLEQTFDRRFAKGSKRITAGFGRPDQHEHQGGGQKKGSGPRQPDPLQTSVGYIGADAYFGKSGGGGRRGGGGGGGGGRGRR